MKGNDHQLDGRLLEAHERDDLPALIALYAEAANRREAVGDINAACFYLTHAFVFALQAGDPSAHELRQRLWAHGREDAPRRVEDGRSGRDAPSRVRLSAD